MTDKENIADALANMQEDCEFSSNIDESFARSGADDWISELADFASPQSAGEIAADFLDVFDPTGWHNLTAFPLDGNPIEARTFPPGSRHEIVAWINSREGRANVYFSVNEPRAGAPDKRLSGDDIAWIRAAHCDVDPRDGEPLDAERDRLGMLAERFKAEAVAPSLAVDSGGGTHFYWLLSEKLDAQAHKADIEGQNRGLIGALGGDLGTHDLPRILRLPGTTNRPDAKKQAKGRVARRAAVLFSTGARYSPETIAARFPPVAGGAAGSAPGDDERAKRAIDLLRGEHYKAFARFEDLDPDLRSRFATACDARPKLGRIWKGCEDELGADKSASAWRFALSNQLGLAGEFDVEDFAALVWVWDRSVQAGDDPDDKLAPRALGRDWARGGEIRTTEARLERYWRESPASEDTVQLSPTGLTLAWIDPAGWVGKPVPEREWVIKGWIPKGEVTLLYGDGGVGKTLVTHQLAVALATGRNWLGQPTSQWRVLCFLCEDSEDELHRRHVDICAALGVPLSCKGNVRLVSRRGAADNILGRFERGKLVLGPAWHQLRRDALEFGANVLILDTITDIFGGVEIDRSEVNAFVKGCLTKLADEIDGTVIALGHPSEAGRSSGRGTSGSTAWNNSVRSRLYLSYPEGSSGQTDIRELKTMKANYGAKGSRIKMRWHKGAFVEIASSAPQSDSVNGADAEPRSLSLSANALPSIDDAAERAVISALMEVRGVRLTLATNSSYSATKTLKRLQPGILDAFSPGEVTNALDRLDSKGAIREYVVGKDGSGRSTTGLEVAFDNLSMTASNAESTS